jgi:TPR repeat protein
MSDMQTLRVATLAVGLFTLVCCRDSVTDSSCEKSSVYELRDDALVHNARGEYAAAQKAYGCACRRQDAVSCAYLGQMYQQGRGTTPDTPRALELYGQACAATENHGVGCLLLGMHYLVTGRYREADTFLQRACDGGEPMSCETLATALLGGKLGPVDRATIRRAQHLYDLFIKRIRPHTLEDFGLTRVDAGQTR